MSDKSLWFQSVLNTFPLLDEVQLRQFLRFKENLTH